LAKHFNTCIFSADSRQFYKELSIGTAKPSSQEQDGIPHFFIDSHHLSDELTSAQYEKEALPLLEEQFQYHDVVILTGGSGMFIDALCLGLDDIPSSNALRKAIQHEYDLNGLDVLLDELREKDPAFYEVVDKNNPARVIRAIEVIRLTGQPYSTQRKAKNAERSFQTYRFVINHDRETLYERINLRVDLMMEAGLLEEVKSVLSFRNLTSMNTVGYKELFSYLDGESTLEQAVAAIKQNTRRYAKRQLTWFRRHPEAHWIKYSQTDQMVSEIVDSFHSMKTQAEEE